jgi:hypothetical protein
MDLTTLAAVKSYIGIANSNSDSDLSALITAVSSWFSRQTHRTWELQSYTEKFCGTHLRYYVPRMPDVQSITTVINDGTTLVLNTDYIVIDNRVELLNYNTFTPGSWNCSCTYTAGFTTPPVDVELAIRDFVALIWRRKDRQDLVSRTIGSGETAVFRPDVTPWFIQTAIDLWYFPHI